MAVVSVGAFDLKKCGCCLSGVLWKARTESCDVLVTDCLMVAGMAKGRRKRNAMVVVVICDGGAQRRRFGGIYGDDVPDRGIRQKTSSNAEGNNGRIAPAINLSTSRAIHQ